MNWYNKVAWSEGLFLRPQLFQQQERYLEHLAHRRAAALGPFYWGFSRYAIDAESLSLGKVVLASAAGIFADGTPFDTPGQALPPAPLTILPEHLEQVIYLAVPIRTPNGEETTFEDVSASAASLARFEVFDTELRDANSMGQGPKTVQLSRLRLRLLPQREMADAWIGLPLTRVTTVRSDGSIELDRHLIPPVAGYGASALLKDWLTHLHGLCRLRAESLAARLSGNDGKSGEAAEVSDFLLLQILNRYEPLFEHWLRVGDTSPEHLYTALRSLSGEVATFVRPGTRRPHPHPAYAHGNPYLCFKELVGDVQSLLNDVLVRSAQNRRRARGERRADRTARVRGPGVRCRRACAARPAGEPVSGALQGRAERPPGGTHPVALAGHPAADPAGAAAADSVQRGLGVFPDRTARAAVGTHAQARRPGAARGRGDPRLARGVVGSEGEMRSPCRPVGHDAHVAEVSSC
jgi:type VI secretion system protein ImpJ